MFYIKLTKTDGQTGLLSRRTGRTAEPAGYVFEAHAIVERDRVADLDGVEEVEVLEMRPAVARVVGAVL